MRAFQSTLCVIVFIAKVFMNATSLRISSQVSNMAGNFGTTLARVLARNVTVSDRFDTQVKMYVYEEMIGDEKLTEIINTRHENVKYLPGVPLPPNVVASPDITEVVRDATLLLFCTPHQFIRRLLRQIKGHVLPGTRAITAIKGIDFTPEEKINNNANSPTMIHP